VEIERQGCLVYNITGKYTKGVIVYLLEDMVEMVGV